MHWDEFIRAWEDAQNTLAQAKSVSAQIAKMLRGNLREVPSYVLADLKRELRDFNIHTGRWNDDR